LLIGILFLKFQLDIRCAFHESHVRLNTSIGHQERFLRESCPIERSYRTSEALFKGFVSDWTLLLDIRSSFQGIHVQLNTPIGHSKLFSREACAIEHPFLSSPQFACGQLHFFTKKAET